VAADVADMMMSVRRFTIVREIIETKVSHHGRPAQVKNSICARETRMDQTSNLNYGLNPGGKSEKRRPSLPFRFSQGRPKKLCTQNRDKPLS
jgi:hypothetical protein